MSTDALRQRAKQFALLVPMTAIDVSKSAESGGGCASTNARENGFQDLRGEARDDRLKDAFTGALKPVEADSCDITPADSLLRLGAI